MKEIYFPWLLLQFFILKCSCRIDFRYVTCGSMIKLYNEEQNAFLNSHQIQYESGNEQSGHQSVSGNPSADDHKTYWIVRGQHGKDCKRGYIIKCGDIIRLQHHTTKRNLHSHQYMSPLSHQQEVSAFGEEGMGDTGDNWEVTCPYKYWSRTDDIQLQHVNTGVYLHMSSGQFNEPIFGHYEVCGTSYAGIYSNLWIARDGVYLKGIKENTTVETSIYYELGCSALHCKVVLP